MKAIKKDGKVIIFIDEKEKGMQELIDKYSDNFDIVEAEQCPTCHQGWVEKQGKGGK